MNEEKPKEKKHNYFYRITNQINWKFYFGIRSCNNLPEDDAAYMGSGYGIQHAIKKYGIENFHKTIIADYPTRKEVSEHERMVVTEELIQSGKCYNIRTGGDNEFVNVFDSKRKDEIYGPRRGVPLSEERKKKTSDSMKGRPLSEEHKKQVGLGNKGKIRSEEDKERIRIFMTGRKLADHIKEKMSMSRKGKPCLELTRKKISDAQMGDKNHRFGKPWSDEHRIKAEQSLKRRFGCSINGIEYISISDASNKLGMSSETIRQRLKSDEFEWKSWFFLNITG